MIRAVFFKNHRGIIDRFEMMGHADSAPYGSDIVCAACSVLAISTVNELQKVSSPKAHLVSDNKNGGLLQLSGIGQDHDSQLLVQLLLDGLSDVANSYSTYLSVTIK